jgi:quinone-modifying oxidoreductase subunit QmoC
MTIWKLSNKLGQIPLRICKINYRRHMNITPDIAFITEIKEVSQSPVKTCMQCGECSVVCSLAPENKPFPRKEMIWTGWGLKEKLMGNPDIWLCHQCGDCSSYCPRNVKPADVIAGIRQLSYKHYARPKFMGKILSNPKLLPLAFVFPAIYILAVLMLAGTFHIPEGPVNYSAFFPHVWLNSSFTAITFLTFGLMFVSLKNFYKNMKTFLSDSEKTEKRGFIKSIIDAGKEVLLHRNFDNCDAQKSRKIAHSLVFYGFILLLLVTAYAIVAAITHHYPLSFFNPFKIAGNVAGLMLITGLTLMIANRLKKSENTINSNFVDWVFILSLLFLTVSGLIVEWARFYNWNSAYYIYFFHLLFVWYIVIYLPYTKFGHLAFRFTAMVFSKRYNR